MRSRNNKKMVIGTLCAIMCGLVVGYASLKQVLNVQGTGKIVGNFNLAIKSITATTLTDSTTISTSGIGTTTANFTVNLKKPGSVAIYDVTVENKGSIDAVLSSIGGVTEANAATPVDIKYTVLNLTTGESLLSTKTKTFQVKVEWLGTSTSIPTTNKTLNLKLNYVQKTTPTK